MGDDKRRRRGLAVIAGSVLIATPAAEAAGPLGPGGPAPIPAAPAPAPKAVTPPQTPMATPVPTTPRGVIFENKATGDTGVTQSDANDISGTIVGAPSYSATPSGEAKTFNPTVDKRGDAQSDTTGGTLTVLSGGTATNTLATPKQFNPTLDKRAGSATDGAQPNAIGTTITLDRGATHAGGALSVSSGGTATSTYAPASKQFNPTVDKRGGSTTGGTQPGANALIVSSGGTATNTFRADKSFDPTIDKRADTDNR